jgi:hypothetical protein
MATTEKKHGVIVTTTGTFKTKTIWNRGHRMITYRHQPKRIRFKSKMVNDKNQHLCGGWFLDGMGDSNKLIERQLVEGRKPIGIMCFWSVQFAREARECAARLRAAGLIVKTSRRRDLIDVEACHDIRVCDIGSMRDLVTDYVDAGIFDADNFCRDINLTSDRKLKSFLGRRWDVDCCPPWLTGLILGYPIENTISTYTGSIVPPRA